jgi:hypothetical protein
MGIYKLEDIIKYFNEKLHVLEEERIEELYNLISNPHLRVNAKDKQWVAFVTQATEDTTVYDAICKILNKYSELDCALGVEDINNAVNQTGEYFQLLKITHKPRIPFYIMVLDELVENNE